MLSCSGIVCRFGGVRALDGVDLRIAPGEIVGLIGPNGSGKSTLVNVISGYVKPESGAVEVRGRDVTGLSPARVRRLGVARTFQNLRLYLEMSVLDNILLGLHVWYSGNGALHWGWLGDAVPSAHTRSKMAEADARALAALATVGLTEKAYERAGNLSYGEQKRLELARATVLDPALLILDEPTAGLSPDEATELMGNFADPVRGCPDRALLIAEHHLDLVASLCTRLVVLNSGRVIKEGSPADVLADAEVIRVYVGG